MPPAAALASLHMALLTGHSHAVIADIDWAAFQKHVPAGSPANTFFTHFLSLTQANHVPSNRTTADSNVTDTIIGIREASGSHRLALIENLVRSSARSVLGLTPTKPIPSDVPLQDFGMDSLMALELRNVLVQAFAEPLSATLLFDYPSVQELSSYLLRLLKIDTSVGADPIRPSIEPELAERLAGEAFDLATMSESDAEALLLQELGQKGQGQPS